MARPLRILHVEDDPMDADLIAATLAADGLVCECTRVTSRVQFLAAIAGAWDLILCDYSLPGFDGVSAQQLARERRPDLPFMFVSGTIGDDIAVERLKEGATDYVLKQRLERLPSAIRRALQETDERRERRRAESEIRRLNAQLEQRVLERTAELNSANHALAQRERELEEAKAFLEQLVAASPSMIFRLEPGTLRATYVSPNVSTLLGYSLDEVLGVPDFWGRIIHPDDQPRVMGRLNAALEEAVAQIEQEYRCRTKGGEYRWVFMLLRVERDASARPTAILGYMLDIEDRKAAEDELQRTNVFLDSVIEHLPVVLFVKEAQDLRYVRFNRAGEDLTGIRRSELIGRTDRDVFPPQLADAFTGADRSVLAGRAAVDIPEEVIATIARGARVVHTKKIPLCNARGEPQYLLGISEDITDRKAAQEAARLSKLEAERASRAKSEFLSRMSHDLRTPLNAILGFAQLLEMDRLTGDQAESVTQILRGGDHLLTLINEVLDIARIEAGHLTLSPEPVPLDEVLPQVVALVRPLGAARGIDVVTEIADGSTRYVHADRQRLAQVLINLVGNAVKYNRDGGSVRLSFRAAADRIRILVSDTGAGIPEEKRALLFQPFERLGADQSAIEGTGLGLALSKGLTEAMGGTIGVESQIDVGSTFWIELPEAGAPTPLPGQGEPETAAEIPLATRGTVLYVEDNRSNVRLLERLLGRRQGVRLTTAASGAAALEAATRDRPDLILLDLHLPDMPGEEVLRRLLEEPLTRTIPVVILSADATSRQSDRLLASGAVAYLTKPLQLTRLLRLLDERLPACDAAETGVSDA